MPRYDLDKKEDREAVAESQAGEVIAHMAGAQFATVREHTARIFELASQIAGGDIYLADLGDAFATPGERQDFYAEVLKAAFLKKMDHEDVGADDDDDGDDDRGEEVAPVEKASAVDAKPIADKGDVHVVDSGHAQRFDPVARVVKSDKPSVGKADKPVRHKS